MLAGGAPVGCVTAVAKVRVWPTTMLTGFGETATAVTALGNCATVTNAVANTPSTVAVIVVVPGATATTVPVELITATAGFELVQVVDRSERTLSLESRAVGANTPIWPTERDNTDGFRVTRATAVRMTVTVTAADRPSQSAVTTVCP
jgi:hypothetical protein